MRFKRGNVRERLMLLHDLTMRFEAGVIASDRYRVRIAVPQASSMDKFLTFTIVGLSLAAIYAIIALYAFMLLIFAVWGRHRLILSPEERYAVHGTQE